MKKRKNSIGRATRMAAGMGMMVVVLCSCATKRDLHELRTFVADQVAAKAAQDTHVSTATMNIDSIVRAVFQNYERKQTSDEQETETVSETVTTTTDSLGRKTSTQQRTTTRTLNRQQRLTEQQQQTMVEERLQQQAHYYDSLMSQMEERMQQNIEEMKMWNVQENTSHEFSLMEKLKKWIGAAVMGAALLIIGLYLTRRWWRRLLARQL